MAKYLGLNHVGMLACTSKALQALLTQALHATTLSAWHTCLRDLHENNEITRLQEILDKAVQHGKTDHLRCLLDPNVCPSIMRLVQKPVCRALHNAVENGHAETLRLMLEAGANVNARSRKGKGKTPLISAIQKEDVVLVQVLLDAKADVTTAQIGNFTPLQLAASHGDVQLVDLLLRYKAPLSANENSSTPLHTACKGCQCENKRKSKENHSTPLHAAAAEVEEGWTGRCKGCKSARACKACEECGTRMTQEVIRLLVDHGAELEARNIHDDTPLEVACKHGMHGAVDVVRIDVWISRLGMLMWSLTCVCVIVFVFPVAAPGCTQQLRKKLGVCQGAVVLK
jgi:hypothetical protein